MKDMKLIPTYQFDYYNRPAIKVGAGVQIAEAVTFAADKGFRTVLGSCPTVGVAGSYSQGGGYGLLASLYGMGADNILEWEVVTVDGKLVKAIPKNEYSDPYWALSGGGGASTGSEEAYWNAVGIFYNHLPAIVDQEGIMLSYSVSQDTFIRYTATAPNSTEDEVIAILNPLVPEPETAGLSLQTMAPNTPGSFTLACTALNVNKSHVVKPVAENSLSPCVAGRSPYVYHRLSLELGAAVGPGSRATETI
ncbi:hypothetical protein F5B21DRAFT_525917 [Xylaria acuta]|nr:hypothetical protein F5B21DRAFT_525917 [Xylaria acuta]